MLELRTPRLRLVCLDLAHFHRWLHAHAALERALGLEVTTERLDPELQAAFLPAYQRAAAAPGHLPWYTSWQLVAVEERRIVGGFCFKGPPGAAGEVEIGYGLSPPFRGRGFMAEAVGAAVGWALAQPGVTAVVAETGPDNPASHRVLERCGLRRYREAPTGWWWRRDRDRP